MTETEYASALAAAHELNRYDDDTLIRELGKRVEDAKLQGGAERKLAYQADFIDTSATQGTRFLEEVGLTWLRNLEKEAIGFLCPKKSAERDKLLSGKSIPELAAWLATAGLVAIYGTPPAWAIVASTFVARKIVKTGIDAFCQTYATTQRPGVAK